MKGRTIFMRVMLVSSFLAFLFTASQATATPVLQLRSGGTTIMIVDESPLDSYLNAAGVVNYSGAVGSWSINVSTGLTESYTTPYLDLSSLNLSSPEASPLIISLSDTNFTHPGTAIFEIAGTTFSTVIASAFYSDSNRLFDCLYPIGSPLTFSYIERSGFSGDTTGSISSSPYSLTELVTIYPGVHSTSFDACLTVPEPGTLLLLGIGFAGIGLYRRYRREA